MKRILPLLLFLASTWAHAGLALLPGSSPQTVTPGQMLAPIRVQVTDDHGAPVPRATVRFVFATVAFGLGPSGPVSCVVDLYDTCQGVTDDSGVFMLPPLTANMAGRWPISIEVSGSPGILADILIASTMGMPQLLLTRLDAQQVTQGAGGAAFQVRVMRGMQAVAGETVRFTIAPGGGPILFTNGTTTAEAVSDANGIATSPAWRSTAGIGSGTVLARTQRDPTGIEAELKIPYVIVTAAGQSFYPYRPLWWGGPGQSGWGVAIPQHGERIFPVYFGYDAAQRPTWKVLQGDWVGGVGDGLRGTLYGFTGAPYFAFDSGKVHVAEAMYGLLAFGNRTTSAFLTLNYNDGAIDPPPPSTTLPIQPFDFAPAVTRAELGVSDIWWGGPSQSGWGISIAEDRGNLFLTWFTYDAEGRATWFAMPEGQWTDDHTWAGPIYRMTGSSQMGGMYSVSSYSATRIGDFTIRFSGTTAATFMYNAEGHSGAMNLQRFDY